MDFEAWQKKNEIFEQKYEELINENKSFSRKTYVPKWAIAIIVIFHGHSSITCPNRRHAPFKIRQVWVPQGTRDMVTNPQGLKAIWVPRTKW